MTVRLIAQHNLNYDVKAKLRVNPIISRSETVLVGLEYFAASADLTMNKNQKYVLLRPRMLFPS